MAINFAAASTAGLNNPGTEIVTLVKDGSGNFINPPSYDKMRAYLSSGEVPMLFVTDEGGETGNLYQLVEYSETENKIRFSNDTSAIEFCAGCEAPVVSEVVPKPLTYDYMPEGYPKKTTGTVTVMGEQELAFTVSDGLYIAPITNALEIVVGQTYTVNWDGTEYECVCSSVPSSLTLGNLSIMGEGADTGEPFLYANIPHVGSTFITLDTSASHTISVQRVEETVTPIDEKYLPENLATKTDVEATQEVLDGVFSAVATFTFDKQTSGRDTFVFNARNYYKISDFNPSPSDVISFKGTRESGSELSRIATGNNCVEYGFFIIVASAGVCSLPVTETVTKSFTAPSAGLYAAYETDNPGQTAGTGEFTLKPSSENYIYTTGLFLKSSTADSTKKFKITVDDSGTISATEVT